MGKYVHRKKALKQSRGKMAFQLIDKGMATKQQLY